MYFHISLFAKKMCFIINTGNNFDSDISSGVLEIHSYIVKIMNGIQSYTSFIFLTSFLPLFCGRCHIIFQNSPFEIGMIVKDSGNGVVPGDFVAAGNRQINSNQKRELHSMVFCKNTTQRQSFGEDSSNNNRMKGNELYYLNSDDLKIKSNFLFVKNCQTRY